MSALAAVAQRYLTLRNVRSATTDSSYRMAYRAVGQLTTLALVGTIELYVSSQGYLRGCVLATCLGVPLSILGGYILGDLLWVRTRAHAIGIDEGALAKLAVLDGHYAGAVEAIRASDIPPESKDAMLEERLREYLKVRDTILLGDLAKELRP